MNKILEKEVIKYLIVSLDNTGKTVYLHSLRENKWEITPDIERATKTYNRRLANMVLENYYYDIHPIGEEWIVMPVVVQWSLVDESDYQIEEK